MEDIPNFVYVKSGKVVEKKYGVDKEFVDRMARDMVDEEWGNDCAGSRLAESISQSKKPAGAK